MNAKTNQRCISLSIAAMSSSATANVLEQSAVNRYVKTLQQLLMSHT